MELVNDKYVKLNQLDLCAEQLKASEVGDESRENYFNNILMNLYDYGREKKRIISEFYISKDNFYIQQLLEKSEITISRQTVLNALVFATFDNDMDMVRKLSLIISKDKFLPSELGDLLDYVLTHSIDINEYFDSEKLRVIYNDKDNKMQEGYVFETKQNKKNKQLQLK